MAFQQREPRAPVQMDVAYEEPGRQVFSPTHDLSVSGVFLRTEEPPKVGTHLKLVFTLPPDGLFVRTRGQVVRHAADSEPDGFGLVFEDLDERIRGELRSFIRSVKAR